MKTYLQLCISALVCISVALMFFGNTARAQNQFQMAVAVPTDEALDKDKEYSITFMLSLKTPAGQPDIPQAGVSILITYTKNLRVSPLGPWITDVNGEVSLTIRVVDLGVLCGTGIAAEAPESYNGARASVLFTPCRCDPADVSHPGNPTRTTVSVSPSPVPSPAIGEQLTISLAIGSGENVVGYQATVGFDSSALRYVSSSDGDYLPVDAFVVPAVVKENQVTLAATSLSCESNGDGTLATLTFEVIAVKASTLRLSEVVLSDSAGVGFRPRVEDGEVVEPPQVVGDVNWDGVVNILDLVFVAGRFGQTDKNSADLNGDGIVNIQDLVLVAGAFGNAEAAPPAYPEPAAMLNASDVKQWLAQARQSGLTDATSQRGILILERLLAALAPKETALLPNYPNPFNPETWIPYQLANAADVRITVYDTKGVMVSQLDLGHQPAGFYTDRGRAAYWDGRNHSGESAASGTYFYQLRAGDYSQMRRMVIVK